MKAARWVLALAGLAAVTFGVYALRNRATDQLAEAAKWLVGGVVLHDAVLAPMVVVAGVLVSRRLPVWARAPVVATAVVLGSVTLLAVPVLGRFGAKDSNPTLLDRDYTAGWLVFAGIAVTVMTAWLLVALVRQRHPPPVTASPREDDRSY